MSKIGQETHTTHDGNSPESNTGNAATSVGNRTHYLVADRIFRFRAAPCAVLAHSTYLTTAHRVVAPSDAEAAQ